MNRRLWLTVLLLPALLLAACGGSSSTPTTSTSSTATSIASTTSGSTSTAAATTTASISVTTPAAAGTSTATSGSSGTTASSGAAGVTYTLDESQSSAQYKARETLANVGSPSDAIGKTSKVSGTIVFTDSGSIDSSASKITIDLSSLQSDRSQRDNYIKQNTLNTDKYPDAVFVPTEVQGLSWPLPTSGQSTFKMLGNLTVHDTTSPTTWDVTATFDGNQVKGTATTTAKFEDFGMKAPKTFLVLSVEDNLGLKIDFVFKQGS